MTSIEDRPDDSPTRVPEVSEVQTEDRSPGSEDFEPHWSMLDFYRSIEKKSVYEAEDMVLERFGSSEGDAPAGAMKRFAV